jgi:MerR family transcriptional regulator/heat shock protein HspR
MTPKGLGNKRKTKGYTISAVADYYGVHQQTLRLYEREGLLKPSRSEGNVRLYTDEDLERLEVIMKLTRDLGVNLAGVEIILNMREKMDEMQREFNRFFESLRDYAAQNLAAQQDPHAFQALVPTRRTVVIKTTKRVSASRELNDKEV